jgi:hypothetical protein
MDFVKNNSLLITILRYLKFYQKSEIKNHIFIKLSKKEKNFITKNINRGFFLNLLQIRISYLEFFIVNNVYIKFELSQHNDFFFL